MSRQGLGEIPNLFDYIVDATTFVVYVVGVMTNERNNETENTMTLYTIDWDGNPAPTGHETIEAESIGEALDHGMAELRAHEIPHAAAVVGTDEWPRRGWPLDVGANEPDGYEEHITAIITAGEARACKVAS